MATYQRLKSLLNKDGKTYAVGLLEWGNATLVGGDLIQFQADMNELMTYFLSQIKLGNLSVTDIIEEVQTSGSKIPVVVGSRTVLSDSYVQPTKEIEWFARMAADPNVTFNDAVLISGDQP